MWIPAWDRTGWIRRRKELTPTAPPTNLAVCTAVCGIALVLMLQLSLLITQLSLTFGTAVEQVWTWTLAGTAPDAISYHGARKYTIASAGAGVPAAPQSGDEENVTHSPQSVTLMGTCPPIDSTVLQIAVVMGVKNV